MRAPNSPECLAFTQAFLFAGSNESVGMHWGTFELADEPFLEPPTLLAAEVKAAGLRADAFNVRPMGRVEVAL